MGRFLCVEFLGDVAKPPRNGVKKSPVTVLLCELHKPPNFFQSIFYSDNVTGMYSTVLLGITVLLFEYILRHMYSTKQAYTKYYRYKGRQ